MKRSHDILLFLCCILASALVLPGRSSCSASNPEKEAAAKAVNAFGIDLYRQIRKPEGNLIFSPYSISACLAMAYAGARGRTESQMAKALHFDLGQPKVSEAFRALNAQVLAAGQGKGAELNIANALWAEKSYGFLKEFLESATINFTLRARQFSQASSPGGVWEVVGMNRSGTLRQLDFKHAPDAARMTINSWVEGQTKDKIKDLLPQGAITRDTRLVLTNAIYFKGLWESQFKKNWTRQDKFILPDGKETKVFMMRQTQSFGYAENPELQVLEMPYKGGKLSMIVLLPTKQKRLEDFEQSLTSDKLSHWLEDLQTREVQVELPKFKMSSDFQLKTALMRMGMVEAFSSKSADFSGMTGSKDLFMEQGIHKAFVDTNEEGTEAAAATGMEMRITGMPAPVPIFRADHPFLFLIRHKPSNCILFFGRVTNP